MDKSEVKKLISQLQDLYGIKNLKLDYKFHKNNKNKVYISTKEYSYGEDLNPKARGLYFAKIEPIGIRLSIEGSQIIGPMVTQNILNLIDLSDYMQGKNIITSEKLRNFVILKHNTDFLGSGLYKNGKIINFVPKERRVKSTLNI